jgi:hypothetical protein
MRVLPVSIVMMALTAAAGAWATAAPQTAEPPPRIFDTRAEPGFGDPRPALRTYLTRRKVRPGVVQHFCVIGYKFSADGSGWAQVHWREGKRLIRWEGTDPDHPAGLLRWGRRDFHLYSDLVATQADVGSSTYLETRAWADGVIADCAARGTRYSVTIPKRRRG